MGTVLMPGEQRVYTSSLWTGKKTEAEVFANAREVFKGVSLRIENVKNQKAPTTAASWGEDIKKLVEWRNKANVYVGNDSKMNTFNYTEMTKLLREGVPLLKQFLKYICTRKLHKDGTRT